MKKTVLAAALAVAALACSGATGAEKCGNKGSEPSFWLGADISGVTADEGRGRVLYNAKGEPTEGTELMRQLGLNATRLRVWVDPEGGWSSPQDVLKMAKRSQDLGMAIMIDFHYSDWWADPGKQYIPAAWADATYEQMCDSLAEHTRSTLQLLKDNGIDVKWVQVGNETSHGFLWPVGRAEDNMAQYTGLNNAGYDAVKSVYPEAQVIVQLDNGFDAELYDRIFDGLKANGGKWDAIGMSLYPFWAMEAGKEPDEESTLRDCIANVKRVGKKYGCPVLIVEVGVDARDPEPGKAFLAKTIKQAKEETDGICEGVFYWAPEINADEAYRLGAFQNDRPTAIMDAFTEASRRYGLGVKGAGE